MGHSAWISNHIHEKVWDEITYPFSNFNSATVGRWISNSIPQFTGHAITYPCWDLSWTVLHYTDVIMGTIASQITSLTIVYSCVYSGADQRKHQSSASLAFVRGIHRGPVNSPHKWPVTRKMFSFDDVIMSKRVPGSYWWGNYHDTLSYIQVSPYNSFEDQGPLYEIWRYLIFKWVIMTLFKDSVPGQ